MATSIRRTTQERSYVIAKFVEFNVLRRGGRFFGSSPVLPLTTPITVTGDAAVARNRVAEMARDFVRDHFGDLAPGDRLAVDFLDDRCRRVASFPFVLAR
jgi:hypothetical protein